HPLKANLVRDLGNLGVHPRMAREVVSAIDESLDYAVAWRQALARLAQCIRVTETDLLSEGGVIAMVGPAGAGKTSVIAKAAAQFAVRQQPDDVAIVAADTARVGAWQQLRVLGRALSINVYPVRDADECRERVQQLAGRALVLIDTAGVTPDAPGQQAFQATLMDPALAIRRYLVSPANIDYRSLQRLVAEFSRLEPEAWVLTKVDESAQIGGALSVFYEHRLPLAAFSAGQRVPDDLERAVAHRVVARAVRIAGGGLGADDAAGDEQFAWAAEQAFA
ncbi:MAG: flagellar biosynthesis protein FlhF, partial [Gammaproteobacteria bacterium]|nr:flagellar biosynthesis protein FlhF [Gammaproteobacteria bacterium]